jgi:hypothetical protein
MWSNVMFGQWDQAEILLSAKTTQPLLFHSKLRRLPKNDLRHILVQHDRSGGADPLLSQLDFRLIEFCLTNPLLSRRNHHANRLGPMLSRHRQCNASGYARIDHARYPFVPPTIRSDRFIGNQKLHCKLHPTPISMQPNTSGKQLHSLGEWNPACIKSLPKEKVNENWKEHAGFHAD